MIPITCLVPRIERLKHFVIIPFVIDTSLLTPEFTFLALVALMGLIQCQENESKPRGTYVAVIILSGLSKRRRLVEQQKPPDAGRGVFRRFILCDGLVLAV